MKNLLRILKHLNNLTNNNLTAKEEAEQILKFLLLKNSTIKCIEIWEALENAMECEMKKRQNEANYISRAVNSKWQKDNSNINALYFEVDALKREIARLGYENKKLTETLKITNH